MKWVLLEFQPLGRIREDMQWDLCHYVWCLHVTPCMELHDNQVFSVLVINSASALGLLISDWG